MRQFGFAVDSDVHHDIIFLSDLQDIAKMREIDVAAWVGIMKYFGLCRLGYARRDEVLFYDHVPSKDKPPFEPALMLTWPEYDHAAPLLTTEGKSIP